MKSILEYRKGILFIRLSGIITASTINKFKTIIENVKSNQIGNIVLNLNAISLVDEEGIEKIEDLMNHSDKFYICSNIDLGCLNRYKIDNELKAFEVINI